MILITKVNIEYFRSLKSVSIKDINHLNIFSGKNDIGKSNILKALDIFFNKPKIQFSDEYNKERLSEVRSESIKGKQFVKISIEFKNTGTYPTLPKFFLISKTWDRQGNLIDGGYKDNFESLANRKIIEKEKIPIARRSLTKFLNKVRYTYIPAIRDETFFSYLLNQLQETIFEVEERKRNQTFQESISNFNDTIGNLTSVLNDEFETVSGISSSLSFPNNISEIFQRLIIETKSGDHNIPLRMRGDGIRLRYIPTILNYISKNSKYFEIWGFDEPENSCEYSLSKKIADQFEQEYISKAQIFLTTHSFHFISLSGSESSKYRVFRKEDSQNTDISLVNEIDRNVLSNELGVLEINAELSKLYESLSEEMKLIENTKDILKNSQKPYLIFEGKTDNELFECAFKALYTKDISEDYILCEHMTTVDGSTIGSGANFINQFMFNHISKTPTNNFIIGVFDYDKTGVNEINALKKVFNKIDIATESYLLYQHKTKPKVFVMTLVTPLHRKNFTHKTKSEYCYMSTELLLEDKEIHNSNRQYPSLFDQTVFGFSGSKNAFAAKIKNNSTNVNFEGFRPTFERIEKIIQTASQ
jgi:AAA15 family ATPase/GTPase